MSKPFPHPFSKLAKEFRKLRRELPAVASELAQNEFIDNFGRNKKGGFRDKGQFIEWAPRKGKQKWRDNSRSTLVDTGRLRRSFKTLPRGDTARVVNTAPYAAIHNEGGSISGTETVRSHTRRTRGGKVTVRKHSRNYNRQFEERPFMQHNSHIDDAIEKELFDSLEAIFKAI